MFLSCLPSIGDGRRVLAVALEGPTQAGERRLEEGRDLTGVDHIGAKQDHNRKDQREPDGTLAGRGADRESLLDSSALEGKFKAEGSAQKPWCGVL